MYKLPFAGISVSCQYIQEINLKDQNVNYTFTLTYFRVTVAKAVIGEWIVRRQHGYEWRL